MRQRVIIDPSLSDQEIADRLNRMGKANKLKKHKGPGPHPSGSPQSVHGSSRVHTARGTGKRSGEEVSKFLTDADGNELLMSFDALDQPLKMMVNGKLSKVSAKKVAGVRQDIINQIVSHGFDPADVDENVNRILESAFARYKDNPNLSLEDRFYEGWHEALFKLSDQYGIDFSRTIAGAAAISPGTNAPGNLHYAADLARYVSENTTWSGEEAGEVVSVLETSADAILNPVWMEMHQAVIDGDAELGAPRPPPKEGGSRWTQGQRILADAQRLAGAESFSLEDLTSDSAAYALHYQRAKYGGQSVDAPGFLRGEVPNGGFGVSKGYDNYAKAVSVMRGWDYVEPGGDRFDVAPSDVLGDIKVRAFHNNILDPTDRLGFRDVTVDFHTVNAVFFTVGADKNTTFNGTPALEGVGFGVRPLVADAIRRASSHDLVPSRVQEILWAEWKRGLTEARELPDDVAKPSWWTARGKGAGPRAITHWQSYDGTLYELPNIDPKAGGGS